MNSIPDYMTIKHRECDEFFIAAESAAAIGDWVLATQQWQHFIDELDLHFQAEESILFPQFEQATGLTSGPTAVMRMEHQQLRSLIKDITLALAQNNKSAFMGLCETLMLLMQQHNMKEEMMLYPMSQQHITDACSVTAQLRQHYEVQRQS